MTRTTYVVALGSNRPGRHGRPEQEVAAALAAIDGQVRVARVIYSEPIGPSIRRFANTAALIESTDGPEEMLARLKAIERSFGRRRGVRWGSRVIDLDIILWSGGPYEAPGLIIPHPAFRERDFVLRPLMAIAPDWRDPLTGFTIRQLHTRLTRRALAPSRGGAGEGP